VTGSQKAVATTQAAFPQRAAPAKTDLSEEDAVPHVQRRRLGLGVAMGGLVLLAAGGAVLHFRSGTEPQPVAPPPAPVTAAPTPPPQPPAEVAARPTEAPPPPAVEHAEPVAAPTAPAPEATAEKPAPEPTEQEPKTPAVRRKVAQKATLEFRIRPYATVFLDGTALGQTPLSAQQVAVGTHKVRLLNNDLGKDIVKSVEVKAGQTNIFKLDLTAQ
jgi:serine/threonine-protein kinase